MKKEITASGKTWQEAVEEAKLLLSASELDDVQYEILDMGSKGIFGLIGTRPAKVRAWIELPDTVAPRQHGDANRAPRKEYRAPKSEAPAAEKNVEESKAESGKGEQKEGDRRRRNRNKNGNKSNKGGMNPPKDFVAPEGPAVIKEAVIPESELKMTPYEAEEGEDLAFDFVKDVVKNLGIEAEVSLFHCEDNSRRIVVAGEEVSALIGHHGDTLDALQYLANLASTRKNKNGERNRHRVTIDIEGYRAKREETLRALARRMAAKALRNNRSVMLEPMSPYERRIIHSEIQGIEGVSTNSIGSDNNRKIVIYLTEKKVKAEEAVEENEVAVEEVAAEETVADVTAEVAPAEEVSEAEAE